MPNTIKNVYLKKKIDGAIVTIYPHTDAGVTSYVKGDTTTTVAAELQSLASGLSSVSSESEIKSWIETAKNEILGITEGDTIDQAYDTLKEVADYLAGDNGAAAALARIVGEVEGDTTGLLARMTAAEDNISDITTAIGDDGTAGTIKGRITAAEGNISNNASNISDITTAIGDDNTTGTIKGRITALETTVDTATTGLSDRMTAAEDSISDLETTVGGFKSGLVKDVADIQTDIGDDSTAASVKGRIAALEAHTQVTMTSTDPTALTADDNTLYIVYEEESVPVVDPTGTV